MPELTERMRETLALIAQGKRNDQIAEALGILSKTVEKHRDALYKAFGVENAVSLVVAAHRQKVIKL